MVDRIQDGVVASIAYTLKVGEEVIEVIDRAEAVEYLHGEDNIVPGLETALAGKQVGDTFTVTVEAADAYGEYDEALVERIPLEEFGDTSEINVGDELELLDEEDDEIVSEATVREITDTDIVLDFNPFLAGKSLTYITEVVSIREATQQEREMGFPESILADMMYALDGDEHTH